MYILMLPIECTLAHSRILSSNIWHFGGVLLLLPLLNNFNKLTSYLFLWDFRRCGICQLNGNWLKHRFNAFVTLFSFSSVTTHNALATRHRWWLQQPISHAFLYVPTDRRTTLNAIQQEVEYAPRCTFSIHHIHSISSWIWEYKLTSFVYKMC